MYNPLKNNELWLDGNFQFEQSNSGQQDFSILM